MSTPETYKTYRKTGRFTNLAKLCFVAFLVSAEATKVVEQSCSRISEMVKTFACGNHHLLDTYGSKQINTIEFTPVGLRSYAKSVPSIELHSRRRGVTQLYTITSVSPPEELVMTKALRLLKKKNKMIIDVRKFKRMKALSDEAKASFNKRIKEVRLSIFLLNAIPVLNLACKFSSEGSSRNVDQRSGRRAAVGSSEQ